ncbi:uncharacterized protein EHS24_004405 [Apiotrichum porosum]|uniref:Dynactin subunit 2 n=1 Tax=Apiotrichum porosum TaxID=105984 RepID=A0A427Y516_9TREE|nr:uncharacterized protein EHS24_004405 [Apiotrichum porosum]RSH86174.1 hypothetical protein EHS24_004405 [Apiotrichum porosum]
MSGKYSGLPDIDSAPDVFETPDEPASAQRRDEENGEDNRKASIPSAGNAIDTSELPSRRLAGEKFDDRNPVVISIPSKESQVTRLRRLQAEVAQLETEIAATATESDSSASPKRRSVLPPRQPVDIVTELSILREKLNSASNNIATASSQPEFDDWSGRLQQLGTLKEGKPAPPDSNVVAPGDGNRTRLGDVDSRLAALERLVGVSDSPQEMSSISLIDSVSRMDHLLNVLTQPRHLDSIARRVKLLLVDLDRASTAVRRGGNSGVGSSSERAAGGLSPADQEALHGLFRLLPRLDPLIPVVPPLLARLRSLSGLHAEALGIAADLRILQSNDRNITEEERELQSIVSGVQQGVTEAATSISKNWESIQGRINQLEQRLQVLVD